MASGGNGGPTNKWTKFSTEFMTSDNVLAKLNDLAAQGYDSVAVAVTCSDGPFVFVGGYSDSEHA